MKFAYRRAADVLWLAHFFVVCIALFGWLVPALLLPYRATLIGVLVSTLTYGSCVLSKWEYELRRMADPSVSYEYSYASYYTYRLTRGYLSPQLLKWGGILFAGISLIISIQFEFRGTVD